MRLINLILKLIRVINHMSAALDRLSASVDALDASEKALAARVAELAQEIKNNPGSPDEATLTALADRVDAITTDMNSAVDASKA